MTRTNGYRLKILFCLLLWYLPPPTRRWCLVSGRVESFNSAEVSVRSSFVNPTRANELFSRRLQVLSEVWQLNLAGPNYTVKINNWLNVLNEISEACHSQNLKLCVKPISRLREYLIIPHRRLKWIQMGFLVCPSFLTYNYAIKLHSLYVWQKNQPNDRTYRRIDYLFA